MQETLVGEYEKEPCGDLFWPVFFVGSLYGAMAVIVSQKMWEMVLVALPILVPQ